MEQQLAAQNAESGRNERNNTMVKDERDILELLKEELAFVEQGGYGRSVRTPWLPKSTFQESPTCINFAHPGRPHPCNECHLLDFVGHEHVADAVPCHYIALHEAGETIEDLEAQDNQAKLETTLKRWMVYQINQIEQRRSGETREVIPVATSNIWSGPIRSRPRA